MLLSLPNELILLVLDPFPTRSLLTFSLVCHRIHTIIARLIHCRLYTAISNLGADNTFLECYHPAFKPVGPYLKCAHLNTDALCENSDDSIVNNNHRRQSDSSQFTAPEYLSRLKASYSHFLPLCCSQGPWINTNISITTPPRYIAEELANTEHSNNVHIRGSICLDENELFSQLITTVWLWGRKKQRCMLDGGVVRIWRKWLRDRGREKATERDWVVNDQGSDSSGDYDDNFPAPQASLEKSSGEIRENVHPWEDPSILWILGEKRAGLKFRVWHRRRPDGMPLGGGLGNDLADNDDDNENSPVNYDVEVQELVIRTTALLSAIEKGWCL
ncbi:hypothetical protein AJ79_05131 [Helicocarpus griseus UAMH5409]|uniref:F-box domain-containing protein n=1 Tax=Helicocarpus griseus UAMH5409 TaxID=1447875 RepID=A0A2B7XPV5_9EURO|nr:hypothetical protein AJ79_05131 [Helicocarpus griseus UAMH5409]